MSIFPGTPLTDALGNGGPWGLVSSDGAEGSLHMNQLQAAIHGATGADIQAERGAGLHASFNSAGVGMEQRVPAMQQPALKPEMAPPQPQNMTMSNG